MGNSCLTDPNGVITMKAMDFYDLIDVVSKKSAQETVKILAASPFYVEGAALGGTETPALCRDAKSDESRSQNLENQTAPSTDMLEGESDMSKRIRQRATIGGQEVWITGNTQQEIFDNLLKKAQEMGRLTPEAGGQAGYTPYSPRFGTYIKEFNATYKARQASVTMETRRRNVEKHILPRFGEMCVGDIKTGDIQKWYDELCGNGYSRETILKLKNIMSPVFDSAVEDGYITHNPMKSKRLTINTDKGEHHKAIPEEKISEIKQNISSVDGNERLMIALLCYTGMRLEEILGLRWEDIDFHAELILIQRAVIHPTRNMPEVKTPKTKSSTRYVPMAKKLEDILKPMKSEGYILGGENPLSYTQQRKMYGRLKEHFQLDGYTAHDFRDTCATEWKESGIPLETISKLLGHSNSAVTEKCYVKHRMKSIEDARAKINAM